jgi:hypothetical protein
MLRREPLTIARIIAWAKLHYYHTGTWPTVRCGEIAGVPGENWLSVENALRLGLRRLRGGTTLARVLEKHLGLENPANLPPLGCKQILSWARAHRQRTGRWPERRDGEIADARGETWANVDAALKRGGRGLAGGWSLARLLAERLGIRRRKHLPRFTIKQILAWADAHRRRCGQWPNLNSGPIGEQPEDTWQAVNLALFDGTRGLRGGDSLMRVLVRYRRRGSLKLRVERVRAGAGRPAVRIYFSDKLLARYRAGALDRERLARMCHVSLPTLQRELRRQGVSTAPRQHRAIRTPNWYRHRRAIARRCQEGASVRRIMRLYHVSRQSILKAVSFSSADAQRPRLPVRKLKPRRSHGRVPTPRID